MYRSESPVTDIRTEVGAFAHQAQDISRRIAVQVAGRARHLKHTRQAVADETNPLVDINRMHGFTALHGMEGFMRTTQAAFMKDLLISRPDVRRIAEIGFNAGHSSFLFLNSRQDTTVTSFDIGEHDYVGTAANYIGQKFPGRHKLVVGDSTETVPVFTRETNETFDLLFIDGGHDYQTAAADIENMRGLARRDNIVIVDDYAPHVSYGEGPTKAWDEAVKAGIIAQESIASGDGRTWAVGRYLLRN